MIYLIGTINCKLYHQDKPTDMRYVFSLPKRMVISAQEWESGDYEDLTEDQIADLETFIFSEEKPFDNAIEASSLPGWALSFVLTY